MQLPESVFDFGTDTDSQRRAYFHLIRELVRGCADDGHHVDADDFLHRLEHVSTCYCDGI